MPRTISEFLSGYDNWQPPADMWGTRPTATRQSSGMYSWVDSDGTIRTIDPYQELYGAIASGEVAPTAEDWSQMFSSNNGIDANEWASLSPEVRAWAQSNPQAFMSQVLSMRNRANGDLLSMGAEGGFSSPGNVGINNGRMDFSNAGYMDINDEWYDSMDFWGPIAVGAFAGAAGAGWFGGPAAEGAAGAAAGATGVDGALAAVQGGMPLSEAATTFGLTDAQMATVAQQAYGGVGATFGGAGAGTLSGVGTTAFDAAALNSFNSGNTLGPGGTPGTLAPDSYWNPVTQTEMPYGQVGSVGDTSVPWYESAWNAMTTPGGTLGKAALSFLGNALSSQQQKNSGGAPLGTALSGASGGSNGVSGGNPGSLSQAPITPQQLQAPEFTQWNTPLGVTYKPLALMDNSINSQDIFNAAGATWNPLAAALRNY